MCRVSVAMAVYNGEKFIEKQIDSILAQFESDDELIISYDNSSDNTLHIVKSYCEKDGRVKLYINENPGLFNNFQNAIEHCTGKYIFISDQDDLWAENKIETVVNQLKNVDYGMVIHNGVHIDVEDNVISESFFDMFDIGPHKWKNFFKPRYSGCCIAFTASMKAAIIPFPKSVGAYDHWVGEIGFRLGKTIYLPDVLIYHRLHNDNYTPKSHRKLSVILKARMSLFKELKKRKKQITRLRKREQKSTDRN